MWSAPHSRHLDVRWASWMLCTPISSGLFTPLSAVPSLDFIAFYTTRTTPGKAADISTAAESIQRPSLRQNQKNQSLP